MSNALLFTLGLWPRVCINCHIENMGWGLVAGMTTSSSLEMATLALSWGGPSLFTRRPHSPSTFSL